VAAEDEGREVSADPPTGSNPMNETLHFGRYDVELSHLDKVLFPDAAITKETLVDYYRAVAERMLPFLADRPVTMQRAPDGIEADGFYQKEIPGHFPEWVDRVTVDKEGGTVTHVVVSNQATLVYLANQGCITPHVWLSRRDEPHHPDRLVFDLDPPEDGFELVRAAARALRALLGELRLAPYLMTTGGRGLHVVVPLDRSADFDRVRAFAKGIADLLAAREPKRFTTEVRKAKRGGRLFLDYLRNGYAQTSVPPFAVRARPGAPVAMTVGWEALDDDALRGDRWSVRDALDHIEGRGEDPWKGMGRRARGLARAEEALEASRGA
jgi:bifunctional non-homologous end joining protein LigD